jgi:aspartyl protease family protein
MIGWACRQLAIWGGLGLLLYAVVSHRELVMPRGDGQAAAAAAAAAAETVPATVLRPAIGNALTYHADPRGQFWVDGAANGANVRFLVDTGASSVALTLADAAAGGIGRGGLAFTARISTANGIARAAPVRLREVRIGQLSINDVPAFVAENLTVSLLGMTFLRRIDGFEIRDGVLTLNWQ